MILAKMVNKKGLCNYDAKVGNPRRGRGVNSLEQMPGKTTP